MDKKDFMGVTYLDGNLLLLLSLKYEINSSN